MGDVNSLMTDFAAIPEKLTVDAGKYLALVQDMDPKKSSGMPGTVMFAPQFKILNGVDIKSGALSETGFKDAVLFDSYLPFCIDPASTASPHSKRQALTKTKRFWMACGFAPDMTAMAATNPTPDAQVEILKSQFKPHLVGKQVVISVGLDKSSSNRINDYDAPGGAAGATAPATGATAPPPTQAPPTQ